MINNKKPPRQAERHERTQGYDGLFFFLDHLGLGSKILVKGFSESENGAGIEHKVNEQEDD